MDTLQRLASVEESVKQAHKRLNALEENQKAINDLAIAAATIATDMATVKKTVDRLDARLECIEHKPGKRWEAVIGQVIQILVATAVGYLLVTK